MTIKDEKLGYVDDLVFRPDEQEIIENISINCFAFLNINVFSFCIKFIFICLQIFLNFTRAKGESKISFFILLSNFCKIPNIKLSIKSLSPFCNPLIAFT